jgi:hypothetical protein
MTPAESDRAGLWAAKVDFRQRWLEIRRDGERNKECAAHFDKAAPRERRDDGRIDARFSFHRHGLHSLQAFMALAARCTASIIAV